MSASSASSSAQAFPSQQDVEMSSILEYAGQSNGHIGLNTSNRTHSYSPKLTTSIGSSSDERRSRLPPSPLVTPPSGWSVHARQQEGHTDLHLDSSCDKSDQRSFSSGSKRGVPHIYHDYSNIPDSIGYVRKKTGGVTQPFPEKLHEMLEAVEEDSRRIVFWLEHGRAFLVQKPKEFTTEIMPKFFKQSKLTSFQRQLNLYGFRRITQGPDAGAYYHEMFLRGRIGLCQRMTRQKVKGTGHKQPADASSEPNFYEMPPIDSAPTLGTNSYASGALTVIPPMKTSTEPLQFNAPVIGELPNRPSHGFVLGARNEISPGMQSVHGAAHLLQGIASGRTFALPHASTTQASTNASSLLPQSSGDLLANSFLPDMAPRNQEEV
ncbi:heat shock transcription factor, other eukaryote [Fistulifera solaris]|uniref:Heat shock transcription factor, other eukaryote n=1 Tax=Fistulifera solaris TaxID=1519565 RepID=A0A1Z5KMZ4_FISSO|nr:heat shock transcription factor, other eukaryote [Fistulifera solaris]|eukprot:GAX27452.1 heat shock transcription factor, other eukaryote [Fistulifera solaris]